MKPIYQPHFPPSLNFLFLLSCQGQIWLSGPQQGHRKETLGPRRGQGYSSGLVWLLNRGKLATALKPWSSVIPTLLKLWEEIMTLLPTLAPSLYGCLLVLAQSGACWLMTSS